VVKKVECPPFCEAAWQAAELLVIRHNQQTGEPVAGLFEMGPDPLENFAIDCKADPPLPCPETKHRTWGKCRVAGVGLGLCSCSTSRIIIGTGKKRSR